MTFALAIAALAAVWAGMPRGPRVADLPVLVTLASAVLFLVSGPRATRRAARRLRMALELVAVFAWELVIANLRVAWDVITPRHRMRPAVVAVPLAAASDLEILLLANMVSLTPGTLSLDVSDDRRLLYVHAMYLHDRRALARSIKNGFERRLLEVMR
jgi:multicomponent Na+:H+ antiporter subunit E